MMRAQLRLALRWFAVLIVLLATMVCGVAFVPIIHQKTIAGVPLAWWLLGVACFPILGWIASRYVRSVERLERRFANMVGGSTRTTIRQ